jgi:acyl-CoA synthetase (AMP-forming)/AMP-acid ligase II
VSTASFSTLLEPMRARATAAPDWPGIVLMYEDGTRETVTATELWNDIVVAATGLRDAGLHADDVVMLIMGHSRQLIVTFLGAMALGAVPTIVAPATPRLDPTLYRKRIETLLRNAAAAAVVIHSADAAPLTDLLSGLGVPVIVSERIQTAADANALATLSAERIAFIQYSSGSGGVPKGIVHTHAGIMRYIESKRIGLPLTADDVVVCWAPLYHDQGLLSGLLTPMVVGFRTVLMSPLHWVRQPAILLQAMHEYGGTVCYMPNFALNHCVRGVRERDSRDLDLRRWRLLLLGGEPVRVDSLRAFVERFAAHGFRASALRAGYGLAEMVEGVTSGQTGPPNVDWISVAALQRDARAEPMAPGAAGATAFVSSGPPKHGAEVRIVGPDGVPLSERTVGEIDVRCDYRMHEYHRRPDLTRASFREGWFRTGDLGYLVAGELYVVGRKSDLIIVGGRNLAPEEIEAVAEQVPGVLPGRTVAFGIADARSGTERVILVCESAQPEDTEQHLALERELRRAMTQALEVTLGEVRMVARGWIVKTSSGKKARCDNRDKYQREFGGPLPAPAQ